MATSLPHESLFDPEMFCPTSEYQAFDFDIAGKRIRIAGLSREHQHTLHAEGKLVWPAAEVLCLYISALDMNWLKGKRILELGAGQGLTGMFLSKVSGVGAILTDHDQEAMKLLQENIEQNFQTSDLDRPVCFPLIWGDSDSMLDFKRKFTEPIDLIVATDVIYYRAAIRPLLETVSLLLSSSSSSSSASSSSSPSSSPHSLPCFLLCNQSSRLNSNYDCFHNTLSALPLTLRECDLSLIPTPTDKTYVYEIRKKEE